MKPFEIALLIGVFLLSYKGTQKIMSTVRGIRNNNYLNIKYSAANAWNGQTGKDDKGFSVFTDPVYSIRAGFKIFNSYRARGIDTIREIITTFAPPKDGNDTANYISYIANKTGINPDSVLSQSDYIKIMPHMIKMEVGENVSPELIKKAYSMV